MQVAQIFTVPKADALGLQAAFTQHLLHVAGIDVLFWRNQPDIDGPLAIPDHGYQHLEVLVTLNADYPEVQAWIERFIAEQDAAGDTIVARDREWCQWQYLSAIIADFDRRQTALRPTYPMTCSSFLQLVHL